MPTAAWRPCCSVADPGGRRDPFPCPASSVFAALAAAFEGEIADPDLAALGLLLSSLLNSAATASGGARDIVLELPGPQH